MNIDCPVRLRAIGAVLVLLLLPGCNLWPGLGEIELPGRDRDLQRLPELTIEDATTGPAESLARGLMKMKARKPVAAGKPPSVVTAKGTELAPMSVVEMRRMVLRNNLSLQVALLTPEIAAAAVSREEGAFDVTIGSKFAYLRSDTPPLDGPLVDFSSGDPALDKQRVKLTEVEQRQRKLGLGLGFKVPLPTGGSIGLESVVDEKSILDPQRFEQFRAATRFSLSHPLLRGAGGDAALASLRVARVENRMAQARTTLAAMRVLARAEKAYWRLYAARRFLDVRAEQFRFAQENLTLARGLLARGVSAQVEVIRAEVGVAKRLATLVVAETEWQLRQRQLKRMLASDRFPLAGGRMIDIVSSPKLVGLRLDTDALLQRARRDRLELLELELALVADGLQVAAAENRVLPLVNLDFTYGVQARDDGFGSAWRSTWDLDNPEVGVGLRFEVPLTNQRRRAQLDSAVLRRAQRLATKRARELMIRQEVLDMVDIVGRNWRQVLAARQTVVAAGVGYDAERQQFTQGFRTMREVFDALGELGNARIREVKAIVAYQVAQIDLAFASGTLLGYARMGFLELPEPAARAGRN